MAKKYPKAVFVKVDVDRCPVYYSVVIMMLRYFVCRHFDTELPPVIYICGNFQYLNLKQMYVIE